jgi:hypothetical protein
MKTRRLVTASIVACLPITAAVAPAIGDPVEVRITRDFTSGSYERYDGSQDATTQTCSTNRREQNEPR